MSVRVVLLLVISAAIFANAAVDPCSVSINDVQSAVQLANTYRQACEKSFFSASQCDSYWSQVNTVLNLQISYQACGRQNQNQFYTNVLNTVQTEGTNTRTSDTTNAGNTQTTVSTQAQSTRDLLTQKASDIISQVNTVSSAQGTQTRTNVATEGTNTRTAISNTETTLTNLINSQDALTRNNLTAESQNTRATVVAQHANTRTVLLAEIDAQAAQTRTTVQTEATATRAEVDAQHAQTRTTVQTESQNVQNVVNTQAVNTRATVSAEANTTRNAVAAEGATTRTLLTNQYTSTTNQVNSAFNTNSASINTLQNSQNNFTTLFIQLMIQMDFSSSSARVDLFQRPAANGGYFEVMRSVVQEVVRTNTALYGSGRVGTASYNWNNGETAYANKNYRLAWEWYRSAYLQAIQSN